MLKALRLQVRDAVLLDEANCTGLICNFADLRNGYPIDSLWESPDFIGINGKQQLEIFAAVKGQCQRIKRTASAQFGYVLINRNAR